MSKADSLNFSQGMHLDVTCDVYYFKQLNVSLLTRKTKLKVYVLYLYFKQIFIPIEPPSPLKKRVHFNLSPAKDAIA